MRGQQTCPIYNTFLTCEQYARTSAHKGASGSRSQSIYELTVPTHPTMWMMWCVKVYRFSFLSPPFFAPLFFNHERKRKAYVYVGPNMYRMTFVFTPVSHRGDRSRILGVRNKKACFIIIVPRENNMPICIRHGNKCKSCLSLTSARWNQTRLATTQQRHVHGLITI